MGRDLCEPKVSVVMPVCNVELCLRECLDSVCGQTLRDIEIICVDDKSEDNSLVILREYQMKDDRLVILENNERSGAAQSRNRGMEIARGKYLSILDADDIFEEDMLTKAYDELEKTGADICGYDFWEFDDCTGEKIRRNNQPIGDIMKSSGQELAEGEVFYISELDDCFRIFYLGGAWQKLYRRSFVMGNDIRFQTLPNANDTYFCSMTMALAKSLVYIHRPLVHYRVNRLGQTIGKINKHPLSLYRAFVYLYEQLLSTGRYESIRREYNSISVLTLTGFLGEMTEVARGVLFHHMQDDKFNSLGIINLTEVNFRYWREYWLAKKLLEATSAETFIAAAQDAQSYWRDRWAWCFKKLKTAGKRCALWGYGNLGKDWLVKAEKYGLNIEVIIDEDPAKQGLTVGSLEIVSYEKCPEEVEVVVVTNPKFFPEILDRVRQGRDRRTTIDFRTFVYSERELEDCIYR